MSLRARNFASDGWLRYVRMEKEVQRNNCMIWWVSCGDEYFWDAVVWILARSPFVSFFLVPDPASAASCCLCVRLCSCVLTPSGSGGTCIRQPPSICIAKPVLAATWTKNQGLAAEDWAAVYLTRRPSHSIGRVWPLEGMEAKERCMNSNMKCYKVHTPSTDYSPITCTKRTAPISIFH